MNQQLPPAGWYPDNDDAGKQRYWDGQVWTEHTVDTGPAAANTQYRQPMATHTFVTEPRSKKKTLTIVISIAVFCMVAFVGCVGAGIYLLGEQSLTPAEYNSISIGDSKSSVIEEYGSPWSEYDGEDQYGSYTCIEYNVKENFEDTYQLCFSAEGQLETKQKY